MSKSFVVGVVELYPLTRVLSSAFGSLRAATSPNKIGGEVGVVAVP